MARPLLHGVDGSPYVSTARLTLDEKGVDYTFAAMPLGANREPAHLALNPFGRVPVLDHDGFVLYETQAIVRYVDQVFPGEPLTPADPRRAARMNQFMNIVDWYVFPWVSVPISRQRVLVPRMGGTPDEEVIAAALPKARLCIAEIVRLMGEGPYLAGDRLSLADLMLAPHIAYFLATPEGAEIVAPHPTLAAWWTRIDGRQSLPMARSRAA